MPEAVVCHTAARSCRSPRPPLQVVKAGGATRIVRLALMKSLQADALPAASISGSGGGVTDNTTAEGLPTVGPTPGADGWLPGRLVSKRVTRRRTVPARAPHLDVSHRLREATLLFPPSSILLPFKARGGLPPAENRRGGRVRWWDT